MTTRIATPSTQGVLQAGRSTPSNQPYRVPEEMQTAVENWARERGRHAKIKWVPPPIGCFSVELSLRASDPRLKAYQEGRLDTKPKEHVRLHVWKEEDERYVPIDLKQLGVSGLIKHLDMGDTWSGRGKFDSIQDAIRHSLKKWKREKEKKRSRARDRAVQKGLSVRRKLMDIPFEKVGIELDGFSPEQEKQEAAAAS